MNRLGIMVDVSHSSHQFTLDAVIRSKTPVIASHSEAYGMHPHSRNLNDEDIKAIAAKAGVVRLVAFDAYIREISFLERAARLGIFLSEVILPSQLSDSSQEDLHRIRSKLDSLHKLFPRATISTLTDHVVNQVSIDYVGISFDFGGGIHGWMSIVYTEVITRELLSRGYSEAEIQMIRAGSLVRVWEMVENYSS